jgi:hypothetical protein
MKLGQYDEKIAINEAVAFLSKSIATLSMIMGIDVSSFNPEEKNPHNEGDSMFDSYNVLCQEVIALNKLLGNHDE